MAYGPSSCPLPERLGGAIRLLFWCIKGSSSGHGSGMGQSVGPASEGQSGGMGQLWVGMSQGLWLTRFGMATPRKSTKGNSLAPPLGWLLLP